MRERILSNKRSLALCVVPGFVLLGLFAWLGFGRDQCGANCSEIALADSGIDVDSSDTTVSESEAANNDTPLVGGQVSETDATSEQETAEAPETSDNSEEQNPDTTDVADQDESSATTNRTAGTALSTNGSTSTGRTSSGGAHEVGTFASPSNYRVIPGFDPTTNLATDSLRESYNNWWDSYSNAQSNYYQDPPSVLFGGASLTSDSNGTYSYARAGGFYTAGLVEFIRVSGDPKALDELVKWSTQLRSNLKDHDGRGYEYFEYAHQRFNSGYNKAYSPQFELTDTNLLDEQILAGHIALQATALHQNRAVNPEAGRLADEWFDYLVNNYMPKWQARATFRKSGSEKYVPPASLGLQNAVNWNHPQSISSDIASWAHPEHLDGGKRRLPPVNGNDSHEFVTHHFGHSYLLGLYSVQALAEYFESGTGNATIKDDFFSVEKLRAEANYRNEWWNQQTTQQADGSRDWWLKIGTSSSGLRSDSYSQQSNVFANALHHEGFGDFASVARMESYAKAYYHPNGKGVYKAGNLDTMKQFSDGSGGNVKAVIRTSALLGCFEPTGELSRLNDLAIEGGTTSHRINGSSFWVDPIAYAAQMSCELSS